MRILPHPARRRRLVVWLALLAAALAFYVWRTSWWPDLTVQTRHYTIRSTATQAETEQAGRALETLYEAYLGFFADLPGIAQEHERLEVNLYGDRAELRRCNPHLDWAEAFYARGRCHAYCGTREPNPHHWLLHEATHQLNHEVARLEVPKWIDEGLATFLGTSRYADGALRLGRPDPDTYPIWWLCDLGLTGDIEADLRNGKVIPLRAIVTGEGGPDVDEEFNLYYVHWWSLTHFLLERDGDRQRDAYLEVIRRGGSLEAFEAQFGPVDEVQSAWYEHLHRLHGHAVEGVL